MAFRINDPVLGEDIAAMVVLENQDTTEEELQQVSFDMSCHRSRSPGGSMLSMRSPKGRPENSCGMLVLNAMPVVTFEDITVPVGVTTIPFHPDYL